jgi:hypothetical protein
VKQHDDLTKTLTKEIFALYQREFEKHGVFFILALTEEKRVEEKKGEFLCPTGCRLPPLPRRVEEITSPLGKVSDKAKPNQI